MEAVLLSVHVLAGIAFVGGSAVAASPFPRYAPVAAGLPVGPAVAGAPADSARSPRASETGARRTASPGATDATQR